MVWFRYGNSIFADFKIILLACILFTVTNDLSYDQRMQRICHSLAAEGYDVLLVGRGLSDSIPLKDFPYRQKRLHCFFKKGLIFYLEFNLRLFFFLLFTKMDCICAIDLDTILPCFAITVIRRKKRVYDAHELFTEQKEVVSRPRVQQFWLWVERLAVPAFKNGYTVNNFIKEELKRRYGVDYEVIRNLPVKQEINRSKEQPVFILYQGSVNEGRSFETLIPAMQEVNIPLVICGKGNFYEKLQQLIQNHDLSEKVILKGYVSPDQLKLLTPNALFGLTLFEATGLNQIYSLSNRFFDYIMAGIPQICVGFPEYKNINDIFEVAVMVADTQTETLVEAMNNLLGNTVLYEKLQKNTLKARELLNWQEEEIKLKLFWKNICTSFH